MFEKIYYINLNNDINKKNFFEENILKLKSLAGCERFVGVDGYYLDIRTLPTNIITDDAYRDVLSKKQKHYGVSLTYGSLGCALSHYLIYKECSFSKKPFLVFEDDVSFDKNFDQHILELNKYLDVFLFDIIFIGYNHLPSLIIKEYDNVLCKPSGLITGLYAYIISPIGANKILNYIFPINKQLDSSISDNIDLLNCFCLKNNIVSVNRHFGSKTQSVQSFKNIHNDYKNNDWYNLFQ
jgi:GR25 family glycosyltransferase involved in LPS biosynthesis